MCDHSPHSVIAAAVYFQLKKLNLCTFCGINLRYRLPQLVKLMCLLFGG